MWKKMKTKCKEFLQKKADERLFTYTVIAIILTSASIIASKYTHSIILLVIEAIVAESGPFVMFACILEIDSRTQGK